MNLWVSPPSPANRMAKIKEHIVKYSGSSADAGF